MVSFVWLVHLSSLLPYEEDGGECMSCINFFLQQSQLTHAMRAPWHCQWDSYAFTSSSAALCMRLPVWLQRAARGLAGHCNAARLSSHPGGQRPEMQRPERTPPTVA